MLSHLYLKFNRVLCRNAIAAVLFCAAALATSGQTAVLTQHNDNARTGQNTSETILNPSNVNVNQFGKLFAMPSDGQVYAQPLYVPGVTIKGGVHDLVIIATENDSVYAYDADSGGAPLWKASMVDAAHGAGGSGPETALNSATTTGCSDTQPQVGITSTPVIDPTSKTIYVEAKSTNGTNYFHRLHALDLLTGNEKSPGPVKIGATVSGTGDGSSNGQLSFDDFHQHNRPGLLLLNGAIYLAYASHCDASPYHGWLFAYDAATFTQKSVYVTTPNGGMGGFWMSGAGVAADASGNIFIATGNGTFDPLSVPVETSESILKLGTTNEILTLLDYFTVQDQANLTQFDNDLGSGGVLLLPDQPGQFPHILVEAGKEGRIYVVNRDQMTTNNSHYCSGCTNDPEIIEESASGAVKSMFNIAAYWNNTLYFWGFNDVLVSYPVSNGLPDFTHGSGGAVVLGFPGAGLSVSSNGTTAGTGIVWGIDSTQYGSPGPGPGPAVLYAFDATNISSELYSSAQNTNGRDTAGNAVKFTVPTVVNGKVYVGTTTEVDVYGLLPVISSLSATSGQVGDPVTIVGMNFGSVHGTSTVTFNGNAAAVTSWSATSIVTSVPFGATTGNVVVTANGVSSNGVSFTITTPYSLAASPATQIVNSGGSTTYTVTLTPGTGFTGTVSFSVGGLPSGATATFSPTTVTASGSTTMTAVTGSASPGIYPLTITGTSGGFTQTTSATLALGVVTTPLITPGTGTYLNSVLVSITDATNDATIYYTTDGTMPTVTPSEQYTGAVTLTASATVNAIAVASGLANSAVATTSYTVSAGSFGLVSWWKFDEGSGTTAADSSGNGNTMSLVNGISWVAGKIGGAISANGTNQYATEPAINLSTTSTVTVAFWANRTYSTTVESVMLESSTNYNNSTTGFGFFPDDTACNGIQAAVHGNAGYSTNCYTQPTSGVWHHLAIIYDKTQAANAQTALYIDGVLQTPTSNLNTAQNTNSFGTNPLYLFSRAGNQFFNGGEMDDLRIYNRALSATEIQQLYQAGSASLVSIAVTPANFSIAKGATQQFTATGTYSDSSTQNLTSLVTWGSTNTAVAMITSGGLATGVGTGSTTISATSGSISGSTNLTVTAPVLVSISVTPANPSIVKNGTQQFTATGTYSDNSTQNLTSSVTWSSTNTAVATITSGGLATGVGAGSTTISATSGSISGSTNLVVTATLVSIAVTPANASITQGGTQQFTATGTYSDNSTQNLTSSVTWSSTNTAVATITSAGLASGVAQGSTTIQATSGSISGSTTLTVSASTGLVGWWKFDDGSGTTAVDSSGNGNTLSLVNGISWVAGKIGDAISANGTNQYATVPAINLSGTSTVTVAFWANRTYSTTVESVLLESSTNYNNSTTGFGFFPDDTQCQGIHAAVHGNLGYSVNCYAQPSSGVWHHIAVIFDKTQAGNAQTALYIDGVLQTPTSNLNTAQNTNSFGNNPLYLFSRGGSQFFNGGQMDDLRIYNRALSATEIQQLYQGAGSASLVSIAVTPANPSIAKGAAQQFTATGTYSDNSTQNLTSSVTWGSTNTAVAMISSGGLATGIGTGSTTISATSGSISGSTSLTVTAPVLVSISVTPANPLIVKNGTQQFTATGTYSDNSTQNLTSSVTWSSTNTGVATITSGGLATGVATGSTTIQATSGSISGSTNLTVTATLVSIAVTPANSSIGAGATQQFTATGTYSDNSTQNLTSSVTWSSTNTAVATITSAGLASGVATGSTTIRATSGSISGSTNLTVTGPVLVSIAVTPANPSIVKGGTQQFTATGTYSDNSTQNLTSSVTWSSTNTAVATISSTGLASGVAQGNTTIRATLGSISGSTTLTVSRHR